MKLNIMDWIAQVLLIVGGLNWGLVGIFKFNLVTAIFGENIIADIVYVLVGLSALWVIFTIAGYTKKGTATQQQM
jgi:hypothetical protein